MRIVTTVLTLIGAEIKIKDLNQQLNSRTHIEKIARTCVMTDTSQRPTLEVRLPGNALLQDLALQGLRSFGLGVYGRA